MAGSYVAIPVATAATLIFNPANATTYFGVTNAGTVPVYLGGSGVTPASGLPLGAGQSLRIPFITSSVYACTGPNILKTPTDTLSANASLGATALTVASGGASFTSGMIVSINDGVNSELVTVGSGSTGTSVVVSATQFAHATGVSFGQLASTTGTSVTVVNAP